MQAVIKLIRRRAVSVCAGGVLLSLWGPVACGDGDNVSSRGHAGSGAGGGAGHGATAGAIGGEGGQGDAGAGATCPTVSFSAPKDGAKLTEADDVGSVAGRTAAEDREFDCHAGTLMSVRQRGNAIQSLLLMRFPE